MIDLYSASTPNGWKVSIALEEMGIGYNLIPLNLARAEQKRPEYLKINPNGRIPAIVDRDEGDFAIFESGAILIYLAEKSGLLLPLGFKKRSQVIQWLMFQMSGIGPMQGQANVFQNYFPIKIPRVIDRYQNETKRLYGVLDSRLRDHEFLVDDFSIADIACYTWVRAHAWAGIDVDDLSHLKRWLLSIDGREAVERGLNNPPPSNRGDRLATARVITTA